MRLDDATRSRLAHTLNYHDTGSPTEADVQALWRAYREAREHIETLESVMRSDATLHRLQADSAQLRRVNLDLVQRVNQLDAEHQRTLLGLYEVQREAKEARDQRARAEAERDEAIIHVDVAERHAASCERERDQATPVLAALDRWYASAGSLFRLQEVVQAYHAWRAAREE
jgi:hypothetical protein